MNDDKGVLRANRDLGFESASGDVCWQVNGGRLESIESRPKTEIQE